MTNPSTQAFPRTGDEDSYGHLGLTKLEHFAGLALMGLCANPKYIPPEQMGEEALERAMGLLLALNKSA